MMGLDEMRNSGDQPAVPAQETLDLDQLRVIARLNGGECTVIAMKNWRTPVPITCVLTPRTKSHDT